MTIKVEQAAFDTLSEEQRHAIEAVLAENRLLGAGERIEGDPNAPSVNDALSRHADDLIAHGQDLKESGDIQVEFLGGAACRIACTAAQAAAVAACAAIPGGQIAIAVCIAAAKAAGDECRRRC